MHPADSESGTATERATYCKQCVACSVLGLLITIATVAVVWWLLWG